MNIPTSSDRLDNGQVYLQSAPFYRNTERLVDMALRVATIPGAVLQREIRPNIPMVEMWPPRFGYPTYVQRQMNVRQVLDVPNAYKNRRDDISGGPAEFSGSARNVGAGNGGW
jgi:hypothetical protein